MQWIRDVISRWGQYGVLIMALVAYSVVQVQSFVPAYDEADPDGYIWMAKKFARYELPLTEPPDEFRYHSHVWVENADGRVTAKFAPGYPLLMAVGYRLAGDTGMFYVSPVLGGLTLVGAFLLFGLWMSPLACVLAVLSIAVSRMYLFYSGYLLTHVANVCFVTWGAYFLWKWYREPRICWGVPAGLFIGYAATIRHTSALMALVAGAALIGRFVQDWRDDGPFHYRAYLWLIVAGSVFPFCLLAYNAAVFGNPFTSGYGLSAEQAAFSWEHFVDNYRVLARGLYWDIFPVVFPLGILGLISLGDWTERSMRMLWFIPLYIIYSAYYWAVQSQAYYRFMIVTIPVVTGAAYALIDRIDEGKKSKIAAITLCGLVLGVYGGSFYKGIKGDLVDGNRARLVEISRQLKERLDHDAVLFTQKPLTHYIGVQAGFRLYKLGAFNERYGSKTFRQKNDRSPRRQRERTEMLREFYEDLSAEELEKRMADIVKSYVGRGRQVAFVVSDKNANEVRESLGNSLDLNEEGPLDFKWRYWRRRRDYDWGVYVVDERQNGGNKEVQ